MGNVNALHQAPVLLKRRPAIPNWETGQHLPHPLAGHCPPPQLPVLVTPPTTYMDSSKFQIGPLGQPLHVRPPSGGNSRHNQRPLQPITAFVLSHTTVPPGSGVRHRAFEPGWGQRAWAWGEPLKPIGQLTPPAVAHAGVLAWARIVSTNIRDLLKQPLPYGRPLPRPRPPCCTRCRDPPEPCKNAKKNLQ
eukprot:gene23455-biopygen1257